MERSFNTAKLIGALTLGTLAGIALGVILTVTNERKMRREILNDTKDLARNLRKKAKEKAKNIRKEDWLANEKDKIVSQAK